MRRMSRAAFCILLALSLLSAGCGDKRDKKSSSDDEPSKDRDRSAAGDKPSRSAGLSRASRRIACEALKQELTIDAYVTRHEITEPGIKAIEALFKRYQEATFEPAGGGEPLKSKIRTRVIEVKTDEDKASANAEGMKETTFAEARGPNAALVMNGYLGFVLKYGAEKETVQSWAADDTDSLEFYLTTKARELRDRAEKIVTRVGVVSGKDEIGPGDPNLVPFQPINLTHLVHEYFPFYRVETVDLKGGEVPIDPELRGLLITQPGKAYTEKELRRIDEFVMRGGKGLAIVASAVNIPRGDPSMTATLERHGLERLVAGYGMEMLNEAILDFGAPLNFQAQGRLGTPVLALIPAISLSSDAVPTAVARVDTSFAPFFRMDIIAFPYASPIVLHAERQPNAKLRVVAPAKSASPSRVLLISASQFFVNPFVYSNRAPPGALLSLDGRDPALIQLGTSYGQTNTSRLGLMFKATIAWLAADADEAELAAALKPVVSKNPPAAPSPSTGGRPDTSSSPSSSRPLRP